MYLRFLEYLTYLKNLEYLENLWYHQYHQRIKAPYSQNISIINGYKYKLFVPRNLFWYTFKWVNFKYKCFSSNYLDHPVPQPHPVYNGKPTRR